MWSFKWYTWIFFLNRYPKFQIFLQNFRLLTSTWFISSSNVYQRFVLHFFFNFDALPSCFMYWTKFLQSLSNDVNYVQSELFLSKLFLKTVFNKCAAQLIRFWFSNAFTTFAPWSVAMVKFLNVSFFNQYFKYSLI